MANKSVILFLFLPLVEFCVPVQAENYHLILEGGYSSYSMKEFNRHMIDEFWGLPTFGGYSGNYFASGPLMRIEAERRLRGNFWGALSIGYLKTSSKGNSTFTGLDTIYQRFDMIARAFPLSLDLVYRFPLGRSKRLFLPFRVGLGYYWGAFRLDITQTSRSGQFNAEFKYRDNGRSLGSEAGLGVEYFPTHLIGLYLDGQARYVKITPLKDDQGRVWKNDLTANGWQVNLDLSGVSLSAGIMVKL